MYNWDEAKAHDLRVGALACTTASPLYSLGVGANDTCWLVSDIVTLEFPVTGEASVLHWALHHQRQLHKTLRDAKMDLTPQQYLMTKGSALKPTLILLSTVCLAQKLTDHIIINILSIALSILREVYHEPAVALISGSFLSWRMHQQMALRYIYIYYMKLHVFNQSGTRMLWIVRSGGQVPTTCDGR